MLNGSQVGNFVSVQMDNGHFSTKRTVQSAPAMDGAAIVVGIQSGDPDAYEKLYRAFQRGIRFFIVRALGQQDAEDVVHDVLTAVIRAIQRGDVREPAKLPGFIRIVMQRRIASHIEMRINERQRYTELDAAAEPKHAGQPADEMVLDHEQAKLMRETLASISKRDREVLLRFYMQEQSPEQICREMHLTKTQLRLLKSRAKARFAEVGKERMRRPCARVQITQCAALPVA